MIIRNKKTITATIIVLMSVVSIGSAAAAPNVVYDYETPSEFQNVEESSSGVTYADPGVILDSSTGNYAVDAPDLDIEHANGYEYYITAANYESGMLYLDGTGYNFPAGNIENTINAGMATNETDNTEKVYEPVLTNLGSSEAEIGRIALYNSSECSPSTLGECNATDSTPPTITDVGSFDQTNNDGTVNTGDIIRFNASVTDNEALSHVDIEINNNSFTDINYNSSTNEAYMDYTVSDASNFEINDYTFTATDTNDNTASFTENTTELVIEEADTTPPVIDNMSVIDSTDGDNTVNSGDNISFTANVEDNRSDVQSVILTVNPDLSTEEAFNMAYESSTNTAENTVTVENASEYELDSYRIEAVDSEGNSVNETVSEHDLVFEAEETGNGDNNGSNDTEDSSEDTISGTPYLIGIILTVYLVMMLVRRID